MHDAPPARSLPALRPAEHPALPAATQPELAELFDFMAEAEKSQLEIRPVTGASIQELVKNVYATPAPIVRRAAEMLR